MDVFFSQSGKGNFAIEVGYFDTVLEIKEKIEKYYGIPVACQTLILNDQVLLDERNTEYYNILHNSHIHLQVKPKPPPLKSVVKKENSSMIQVIVNYNKKQGRIDIETKSTIIELKEKALYGYPLKRFATLFNGEELKDENRTLEDYGIGNRSEISFVLRPFCMYTISTGGDRGVIHAKSTNA